MPAADVAKYTKSEVDYSPGKQVAHCGICEHYRAVRASYPGDGVKHNGRCTFVEGDIDPQYWCTKFARGLHDIIRGAVKGK